MYSKKDSTSPMARKLYSTVKGKKFEKNNVIFSGHRDTDISILEALDDEDLINFCTVDTYINDLCKDDKFWAKRTIKRYGSIIGNSSFILKHYKPADIPWKDYYMWIVDAIDGDPFFTYVRSDALGRKDIISVLEYVYPQYFSNMDDFYLLSPELSDKLERNTLMTSDSLNKCLKLPSGLFNKQRIKFFKTVLTKKLLFYILASFALEPEYRSEQKNRFKYNLPLTEKNNIDPLHMISDIVKNLEPVEKPSTEIELKIYDDLLNGFRKHFIELGIDLDRDIYSERILRNIKYYGALTGIPLGIYLIQNFYGCLEYV